MFYLSWLWQREAWRAFWREGLVVTPAIVAVAGTAGCWWLALGSRVDQASVLRYSIYVGITELGSPTGLLLIPSLATACVVTNLILAYAVARQRQVLRLLWLWGAVLVTFAWLWLSWLLYRLNS